MTDAGRIDNLRQRRGDTEWAAGRLGVRLTERFGKVFMDIDQSGLPRHRRAVDPRQPSVASLGPTAVYEVNRGRAEQAGYTTTQISQMGVSVAMKKYPLVAK